jgi:hypothetical protein
MTGAGPPDQVVHIKFFTLTAIERIDPLLEIGAQRPKFYRMFQQLSPDPLLIRFGQCRDLFQGFFKDLNHHCSLS